MTYDAEATPAPEADGAAKPWLEMLREAETADRVYQDKCDSIDKIYADLKALTGDQNDREFQIFWANLEVLKPTIYSRPPVPVVTPRFRDRRPLPRRAAEILERALMSDYEADDVHSTLKLVRDDLAIASRGVVWLRLGKRDGVAVPLAEHIDRKDFRHEPARKWSEVSWVARRAWMTRDEVRERFGGEEGILPTGMNFEKRDIGGDKDGGEQKAEVWEMWHRGKNVVVWVCPDCATVLDKQEPHLSLTGFFPCPRPAYGTVQRATLIPVPDFVYYRDQVEEINELTARVSSLSEALRLRGWYPAGNGELSEAIESALKTTDNRAILVPVSSFAALGGANFRDSIVWLPVRDVAEVIVQLVALRKQLIEDVYQITGLSDIMRGETAASETLGAQQLKTQYGAIRVRERQEEMIRVARDVTRLKAEIMAEEIPLTEIMQMAQVVDLPTQADLEAQAQQIAMQARQAIEQAMAQDPQQGQAQAQQIMQQAEAEGLKVLDQPTQEAISEMLQNQRTRPFVLDIETDSTIQPDENAEKQRRTEYITAVGGFITAAAPLVASAPEMSAFVGQALKFLSSGFRAGREMDMAIDELVERMSEDRPNPAGEAQAAAIQAEAARADALAQAEVKLKDAQAQSLMMRAQGPAPEPVSVDPMDQARMALDARKLDQADMKMQLDAAAKYADLMAAEQSREVGP